MRRRQQNKKYLLIIMLFSAVLTLILSGSVLSQATIPTRTPTPDPEEPTDPPPEPTDDDGNGGDNTPEPTDPPPSGNTSTPIPNATNTPVPGETNTPIPADTTTPAATNTLPPTQVEIATATSTSFPGAVTGTPTDTLPASATPFGGVIAPGTTPVSFPVVATAYPTAEICGEPPTFTTLITALVYAGPGNQYEFIETLASDESRPIVGRAIYNSWWLIQLDGKGTQAWINDRTGIVQGYTTNVPEVPAPAIDGVTPTPGIPWEPTPVHDCALTPTPVASDAEAAVAQTTTEDGDGIGGSGIQTDDSEQGAVESDQREIAAATAAPLEIPGATSPTPNLLPIAGLILIIAAVFVALFLRRNPGGGEPTS